ncbi:hypothetical protein EDD15DRAFT_1200178 [Pisolithus albus]|nr:hypothetical protein EDD15DRAFT_1200178 [Pisolithus albus]
MVVTRWPPLLPHPLAMRFATTVSLSFSIHASRFSEVSYYSIHTFKRCTLRYDQHSQSGGIWIIVDGGISERFCQYLRTGCVDSVNSFFYMFSMFHSTVSSSFILVATVVIIRRPRLSPTPMRASTPYFPQP